jgi:hypothetical protein
MEERDMRTATVQYEILVFAAGILLLGDPAARVAKRQKVQPDPKSLSGVRAEMPSERQTI